MPRKKQEKGLTLIEVIAVLVIIGVVAVVVILRATSTANVNNKTQAETLKSHIRYVQMRAMNTDSGITNCMASFGISMSSNNYFMFKNCDTNQKVTLPGSSTDVISFTNCTLSPGRNVNFDRWGRPSTDADGATPYNGNLNITLGAETIQITRDTGLVP